MPRLPTLPDIARWLHRAGSGVILGILLVLVIVLVWARQRAEAEPDARFALDSDEAVLVYRREWIVFQPRDAEPTTGMIFYPGGKAEPAAYAPILRALAARGVLVVLLPMPLNLAFLDIEAAGPVMERFDEITHWFVAGHSLGGVAASEFAQRHAGQLSGLVLWASYPATTSDLSSSGLPVLSVSGTADTLTTPADVEGARALLPPMTRYAVIEEGDHWDFGSFVRVPAGAGTSRIDQQNEILAATYAFLEELGGSGPAATPDEAQ
jgi:hypothetical protein